MIIDSAYIVMLVFFLLLGWVALFIHRTLKKEQEFQDKERETFIRYQKILKEGHDEARRIVSDTAEASAKTMQESHETNEHLSEQLDTVMQHVATEHITEMKEETDALSKKYEESLTKVEKSFGENTDKVVTTTQKQAEDALSNFTKSLIEKTASSESIIDNKTKELLEKVEIEVDTYKRGRVKKLDEEIAALIKSTYTDVMHRTMPESLHHELIIESLEKAKKDGVFNL